MLKRVMIKISGEALQGKKDFGIDYNVVRTVVKEVIQAKKTKSLEIALTVGAGNIWRARDNKESGIERSSSDAIGMLATIMNSVAMQSVFEELKTHCRVCSSIDVPQIAEPYLRRRAVRHLEKGRIVICAAGTGNPYFTTDSAAALRALELNCDVLLKGTNVEGVYDKDPDKNKNAELFETLSFQETVERNLQVMDQTAIALCRESKLPIHVFNLYKKGNLLKAVKGEKIGTIIN